MSETQTRRMTKALAKRVVREFKGSRLHDAWRVTRLQEEIVDVLVMDQIRAAWMADSTQTFTPSEVMEFRGFVRDALRHYGITYSDELP